MDDKHNIIHTDVNELIVKRIKWAEARRQRRLDPEVRARERVRNLIAARRRRQDPELREKERERNRIAMRIKRQNPEFREKEKRAYLQRLHSEKFKMMEAVQLQHASVMHYEMYLCHLASGMPAKSSGFFEKNFKYNGGFFSAENNGALPLELEMRVEEEEEDDPDGIDSSPDGREADESSDDMTPLPLAVTITPLEGGVNLKQEDEDQPTSLNETTVHEEVNIKEEDGRKEGEEEDEDEILQPPLAVHIKEEVREEDYEDEEGEEVVVEPPMPVYDLSDEDDFSEEKTRPQFAAVNVEEGQHSEEEILPDTAMVVVPGRAAVAHDDDDNDPDYVHKIPVKRGRGGGRGGKRGRYSAKRVNTVYRCSDCQVCYSSEEYLKNHIHWGCRSRVSVSGVDTVYRCPNCSLCYTSPQYLAGHVRRGCRYRPAPIKNAYSCIVCGDGFDNYGDLYQHKRAKHDSKLRKADKLESMEQRAVVDIHQARTFNCPNCPRSFTAPGYLLQHQRSHMRTRTDHSCDVCGEDFRDKSFHEKEEHFTTSHPKTELHRCLQCEKIYGHRLNLVMHLEAHGVFLCSLCNEEFTSQVSLSNHVRIHSANKIFECEICNKKFVHNNRYITHMQQEHKTPSDSTGTSDDCKSSVENCSEQNQLSEKVSTPEENSTDGDVEVIFEKGQSDEVV